MLFEAIAGRVPFDALNYNALVQQIIDDEPPALHDLAAVDEQLSAIVARGLSKERSQRYGSMVEMGRALAGWLHAQGELQDACGTSIERRWLRGSMPDDAFGISSVWRPEPGSGMRVYDHDVATEWPAAEQPPHDAPLAAVANKRVGARIAAVTLITAALGFAFVAWYQAALQEHATAVNLAAVKRAAEAKLQRQPQPANATAAGVAPPAAASLPESFATAEAGVTPPSAVRRQRRPLPLRPARSAPAAATTVPAMPHTKSDLIKPY